MNFLIKTNRLLIKPFELTHITEEYLSWMNDKEILSFSEQRHKKHTFETSKRYLSSFYNSGNMFLAIEEKSNDIGHVGNMSIYIDSNNGIADLSIMIGNHEAQQQGYATEAWTAICKYLLTRTDIRKITAGTLSINLPMIRIMKKAGMREDGKRTMHYKVNDEYIDLLYMAIFRD